MNEGMPKPDEFDQEPLVDPNQVAEAAALEDPEIIESDSAIAADMQEDTRHSVTDQMDDDSVTLDSETEARLEELRNRGRVGVLTQGNERPDTSERTKNSDHDPEAIAAVNKANRATQERNEDGTINRPNTMSDNYGYARERRAHEIEGYVDYGFDKKTKLFEENPEEWEAETRTKLEELYPDNPEHIEDILSGERGKIERIISSSDRTYGEVLDRQKKVFEKGLKWETGAQDAYRGDLLDLYARDPEKYKALPTEEFIAEGRKFQTESFNTARIAKLESFGKSLQEELPELVEKASSISDFCKEMDNVVNRIRWQLEDQGDNEELYGFLEAVEGKEVPRFDTLPKDKDAPGYEEAYNVYFRGEDARKDTRERLYSASMHGYFRPDNFTPDLDRSPREQMREAVERAKVFTNKWIENGQKAREEFEKSWGDEPEDQELPQGAR